MNYLTDPFLDSSTSLTRWSCMKFFKSLFALTAKILRSWTISSGISMFFLMRYKLFIQI